MKVYVDTETCGLTGPAVLIQYSYENDEKIHLHHVFDRPVGETLALIEELTKHDFVGFNIVFDLFHLNKLYNMLYCLEEYRGDQVLPRDYISYLAEIEPTDKARRFCVKFHRNLDLFSIAKTTKYQMIMERKDIIIRRVPTALAQPLITELEKRVILPGILFARKKDKYKPDWVIQDIIDSEGNINEHFVNLVLKFKPSAKLKDLMVEILKHQAHRIIKHAEIALPERLMPLEYGFAPFAKAVSNKEKDWKGRIKMRNKWRDGWAWPGIIEFHIRHWRENEDALQYALDDVKYNKILDEELGFPEPGDVNSELCNCVAAVRWKGYAIDIDGFKSLIKEAEKLIGKYPTAPRAVKQYIYSELSKEEQTVLKGSTKKVVLETIAGYNDIECVCTGFDTFNKLTQKTGIKCNICDGLGKIKHPAADKAKNVLEARKAKKKIELYSKFIIAGRFHVSNKIIGALSNRMSGSDGLNAQGIEKVKNVRRCFPLSDPSQKEYSLFGGDFDAFEIVIAIANYGDEKLLRDVTTIRECHQCKGREGNLKCKWCGGTGKADTKIHALFGTYVYPHMTYEEILDSSGTVDDKYTRSKSALFALLYGGQAFTLKERLGVPIEVADKALHSFQRNYPGVGVARNKIIDMFSALTQPQGIGSAIYWKDPHDYIESLFGFRRYFNIENSIIKTLFGLAQSPPKEWANLRIRVRRRERIQTACGAVQSSLYGAAFSLQSSVIRAAQNHVIQSTGASMTKVLQNNIWQLQPQGISQWLVQPMNVHDEILTVNHRDIVDNCNQVVEETINSFKDKVPLVKMAWQKMKSWAEK